MVIIAHSKSEDNSLMWYESIVTQNFDRVEMFRDPELRLYDQVGMNWSLNGGPGMVVAFKNSYGGMLKQLDKQTPGWDKKGGLTSEGLLESKIGAAPGMFDAQKNADYLIRTHFEGENPSQQGGDVLLDGAGKIQKVFTMNSVFDRVKLEDIGV